MDGALLKKEDGINLLCTKKTQDAYCSAITKSMYIFYPVNQTLGVQGKRENGPWVLPCLLWSGRTLRNSIMGKPDFMDKESTYKTEKNSLTIDNGIFSQQNIHQRSCFIGSTYWSRLKTYSAGLLLSW